MDAKSLNKRWCVGASHALYSKSGRWFHRLQRFPGALFDPNGYILFPTEEDYLNCSELHIGKELNVPKTISKINGYIKVIVDGEERIPDNRLLTPNTIKGDNSLYEGAPRIVEQTIYERDPVARKICLDHFGTNCIVCGINLYMKYGEVAKGLIHVHHIVPLSEIARKYKVNPINDLRPVCPNCHSVIHRRNSPFSIEEVQEMLKSDG